MRSLRLELLPRDVLVCRNSTSLNLLLFCNLCSYYDIKVFQELFSFRSGMDYVLIQCSWFYFICYLILSTRSKDPALFVYCGNGDLALTGQSVMPLLYSTRPVDQIYRASVVPYLLGKTEDKEMTEMWVPLPEGYSMGNAWPQTPPPLNRLTMATKITFRQTQYTHGPRAGTLPCSTWLWRSDNHLG